MADLLRRFGSLLVLPLLTLALNNTLGAGLIFLFGISIVGIPVAIVISLLPAITLVYTGYRAIRPLVPLPRGGWRGGVALGLAAGAFMVPAWLERRAATPVLDRIIAANAAQHLPAGPVRSVTLVVPDRVPPDEVFARCAECGDALLAGRLDWVEVARLSDWRANPREMSVLAWRFTAGAACRDPAGPDGKRPGLWPDFAGAARLRAYLGQCLVRETRRHAAADLLIAAPALAAWPDGAFAGVPAERLGWAGEIRRAPVTLIRREGSPGEARAEDIALSARQPGGWISLPYFEPLMGSGTPVGMEIRWTGRETRTGIVTFAALGVAVARFTAPAARDPYGELRAYASGGRTTSFDRTAALAAFRADLRRAVLVLQARPGTPSAADREVVENFVRTAEFGNDADRTLARALRADPRWGLPARNTTWIPPRSGPCRDNPARCDPNRP